MVSKPDWRGVRVLPPNRMTLSARNLLFACLMTFVVGCSVATGSRTPEPLELQLPPTATTPALKSTSFTATPFESTTADLARTPPYLSLATLETGPEATAEAGSMWTLVTDLHRRGILNDAQGKYQALQPFEASWAQIDYYDFLPTGHSPGDFVLRADVQWESASERANFWNSGCGFVFRMNARGDHYLVFLGLDGNLYLYRKLDQVISRLGSGSYREEIRVSGSSQITLAVEGQWMTVFVNGEQVYRQSDDTFSAGLLGYALASGTNKDFGTRCEMTNVELWEIGPP